MDSSYKTRFLVEALSNFNTKKMGLDYLLTYQVLLITFVHFKRWSHIIHLEHDGNPPESVLVISIYLLSFSNILWHSDYTFVSSHIIRTIDLGQYSITLLQQKFEPPGEIRLVGITILNCILSQMNWILILNIL